MVRFVANVLRHTDYIVEEMLGIKSRIVPILQLVHNLISFDAVEGQVEELHVLKSTFAQTSLAWLIWLNEIVLKSAIFFETFGCARHNPNKLGLAHLA